MSRQLMGQLPTERLSLLAPFEALALDLFGPFPVSDPARGRRTFKCYVVCYVCMASKAVALLPCPGYCTNTFMTTHQFFVKGCSWRNGLAERVVRSARHTLFFQLKKGVLQDFHQFGATLSLVASIINSRPLSIRTSSEGELLSVSPRDVLLGRSAKSLEMTEKALGFAMNCGDDEMIRAMENDQAGIIVEWRRKWLAQTFPNGG